MPAAAGGGTRPVRLGTVAATVGDAEVRTRLPQLVKRELAALPLPATSRRTYLLDVSLDELTTTRLGARSETTCEVSATLRDATDGALHAILKGHARGGDSAQRATAVRSEVLSGAVRSALRRVPDAVER